MAAETLVDLLRHGETAGGERLRGARSDGGLTSSGWAALARTTGACAGWDIVFTSPLARCHAFAASLAARSGRELVIDERLREYDFGAWDGRPLDTLWAEQGGALAAFLGDPERIVPPNGETATAFRDRVRAAWAQLLARAAGRRALLVGHGGVLRQIVVDVLGAPGGAQAAIDWPYAALSRVRVHDSGDADRSRALVFHAFRPGGPDPLAGADSP